MLDLRDQRLHVAALEARLHLYQIAPTAELPEELQAPRQGKAFYSITYADDEVSIISPVLAISEAVMKLKTDGSIKYEGPWTCLKVNGPMDLTMTGRTNKLSQKERRLLTCCRRHVRADCCIGQGSHRHLRRIYVQHRLHPRTRCGPAASG
jgi:hypothetical protein